MNLPKQIPMFTKDGGVVVLVIELGNTIVLINASVSTHFVFLIALLGQIVALIAF
jgi:hypothetical protein